MWSERLEASAPPPADAPRQKAWDTPAASLKALAEGASDTSTQARLLTACRNESGAWLQALPVSSLGLQMSFTWLCGTPVDGHGTHGLHCCNSVGHHPCHSTNNDLIKRSLASAKISAHLKPVGVCTSDGKRPDGATVLPWRSGRVLVWDAMCPDTFAPSHIDLAAGVLGPWLTRRNRIRGPSMLS